MPIKKARLLIYLSLLVLTSKTFALENIGFCHEYLNEYVYEVIPGTSVQLTEDQLLVRGELDSFHEQGMESYTMWSVFERQMFRQYE